jgi:hypothetical protein
MSPPVFQSRSARAAASVATRALEFPPNIRRRQQGETDEQSNQDFHRDLPINFLGTLRFQRALLHSNTA